jgi:exopolysaccharide production protein ExoZ
MQTAPGGTIHNIQVLRAFAATSVVFLHVSSNAELSLSPSFGAFGVDVFFVISGYIITYVAFRDPAQFMRKRIIRIVPAYWTMTLLIYGVALLSPSLLRHASADPSLLVSSLFFIPHETAHGPIPTLALGWTLNYEMYFYLLFAIGLVLSKRYSSVICTVLILVIMALTDVIGPRSQAAAYYGQPIVLEFVYGILIYHTFRLATADTASPGRAKGAGFGLVLVLIGGAILFLAIAEVTGHDGPRFAAKGLPAAALVAGALLLETRYAFAWRNKAILLLGEASYVLYLIHPFVLYGFTRALLRGAAQWPDAIKWPLALLLVAITASMAIAVHYYLEAPAMLVLRKRFIRSRKGDSASLPATAASAP